MFINQTMFKMFFYITLLAIFILSITPHPNSTETKHSTIKQELSIIGEVAYVGETEIGRFSDKYRHLVAFWVLALLFDLAYRFRVFYKFYYLIFYGVFIEAVQYFLPYRDFDIYDIFFNTLFIILYFLFRKIFLNKWLSSI